MWLYPVRLTCVNVYLVNRVGLHDLGGNLKWIKLYTYHLKVVKLHLTICEFAGPPGLITPLIIYPIIIIIIINMFSVTTGVLYQSIHHEIQATFSLLRREKQFMYYLIILSFIFLKPQ